MKPIKLTNMLAMCLGGSCLAVLNLQASPLTWFPGPPLDSPISGAATAVLSDGSNLLIGGDYNYFESFPISLAATNSFWTYYSPLYDSVRIAPGAVVTGDGVLLYGGTDGTNSTSSVISFSLSGDTMPTPASMSVPRSYLGYAPDASGNAYAFGGLDDTGQPLSSAESYNPDSDSWTPIASLPTAQYNFPAVFDHTNQIYIFGGRTNTTDGTEIATVLRYSVRAKTWTHLAPMPIPVAGSAAAFGADGKIYLAGGVSGGVTTSAVQVYNPAANSWVVSTPLPEGLSASAMGVDSLGRLILMGGMDVNGNDVSDVWRSQRLAVPDSPPVFTQYPATNAAYQVSYTSSISATGNPQPTFVLLNGPATMQVDPYSGAISWTPEAADIGTNSITIRATNYVGYVDWNFSIPVAHPRPTMPTNLAVVSVTDNSVTLSWDPEDPVVGPVSYSFWLRHVLHDPKGSGATVWYTGIGGATTGTTITITGLAPGTSQTYYVVASGPGGTSGYGPAVAATTTAPHGPPDLFVTGLTSTSVSLAWDPAPGPSQNPLYSPITSYTIMERNMSVSPPVNVPTVTNITGTNGTITGLTPGHSHIWFVSGVDAAGNSSPLTYVYVTVTNPVPAKALVSPAGPVANGNFQFTVQQPGPVVQTVLIEANPNPADPAGWVQIGSLLPGSSSFTFTDTNAAQFPARFYRVIAP